MDKESKGFNTPSKERATISVAVWISLATSVILFNKVIISTWDFNYPCFLTFCQSIFALIATQLLSFSGLNVMPGVRERKIKGVKEYLKKVVPIALCFSVNIMTGNKVYAYLSLGYIQMLKAMGPVPVLIVNILVGREKASLELVLIVLLVTGGVISASAGELLFNWIGFGLQFASTISDCFRCVLSDMLLKNMHLDSLSLVYYISPISSVCLGLGFMSYESEGFPFHSWHPAFIFVILINCLLVFLLNVAVYTVLGNTSSMVMSLSGPMKVCSSHYTHYMLLINLIFTFPTFVSFSLEQFLINLSALRTSTVPRPHIYQGYDVDIPFLFPFQQSCYSSANYRV